VPIRLAKLRRTKKALRRARRTSSLTHGRSSFPNLAVAREHGVAYADVLLLSERLEERPAGRRDLAVLAGMGACDVCCMGRGARSARALQYRPRMPGLMTFTYNVAVFHFWTSFFGEEK
jgi:hypothetical protein